MTAPAPDELARLADLAWMRASLTTLAGPHFLRVFKVPDGERPDPLYLKRDPRNRFDSPAGGFSVLYAAFHLDVCLAEVLSRQSAESPVEADRTPDARYFVGELCSAKPLRVIDLTRGVLPDLQAGDAIGALRRSQAFSEEVYRFVPGADGIIYRSIRARGNALALALFERGLERAGLHVCSVVPLSCVQSTCTGP